MRIDALKPLPVDQRDFSHDAVFGSISVSDLPDRDFIVAAPLEIKNQDINYTTDFCTAYGASECAEDQDQVIFVPEWTFAQAKAVVAEEEGVGSFADYGLSLRDICKAAQLKGFLPRIYDPFKCDTNLRPQRSLLVNPGNWPATLDSYALPYRKPSYFLVTGPHDLFDNMRSVLWKNIGERRSILTGCLWRESWNNTPVIPKIYEESGAGHSFKICGQKTINGEIYLIAQLSEGDRFGDKGFFYFPREVINKEFKDFGAFTFSDMQTNKALWYLNNGVSIYDSTLKKVWRIISNFIGL